MKELRMSRQVFCIKEETTNTWCRSSKFIDFTTAFDEAAIFLTKENVDKAAKDMVRRLTPKYNPSAYWSANRVRYTSAPTFIVVAFNLVAV